MLQATSNGSQWIVYDVKLCFSSTDANAIKPVRATSWASIMRATGAGACHQFQSGMTKKSKKKWIENLCFPSQKGIICYLTKSSTCSKFGSFHGNEYYLVKDLCGINVGRHLVIWFRYLSLCFIEHKVCYFKKPWPQMRIAEVIEADASCGITKIRYGLQLLF